MYAVISQKYEDNPQKIYNSSGTSIIFSRHLKRNIFFSIKS